MPSTRDLFPLAVCVAPAPADNAARTVSYPGYVHEILDHAGVCYASITAEALEAAAPSAPVLLTVGEVKLSEAAQDRMRAWVAAGGAWVAVAGVCGMADLFGVEVEPPTFTGWGGAVGTLGEGYLMPGSDAHPVVAHAAIPLHYFNGLPVHAAGATVIAGVSDAHQRATGRAAVTERIHGAGRGASYRAGPHRRRGTHPTRPGDHPRPWPV